MEKNSDFNDLLADFVETGIRFLIVGGYAVIKYTEPYYTKDLDIWIEPDLDNARRVFAALKRFGAPLADVQATDLINPELFYQVGVAPVRIDIMSVVPGLSFVEAWLRRETADFGGVPVPVLSLDDVLLSKRTTNRPKDRIQVRQLELAKQRLAKTHRKS